MNIKSRIEKFVSRLVATNYAIYDGEKEDCLEDIERAFDSLLAYANHVIGQQYQFPMWRIRYEGEEFREKVSASDSERRNHHLGACASVNMLNRLFVAAGVKELFPGIVAGEDREGRRQAAIAIGTFCLELYCEGIGTTPPERAFDVATYGKDGKTYDPEVVHTYLMGLAERT